MDLNLLHYIFNTAITFFILVVGTAHIGEWTIDHYENIAVEIDKQNWLKFWLHEILFVLIILKIYLMTTFKNFLDNPF